MEVLWPVSLLLLLAMQIPCHSQKGLTCDNDYVNNISCTWNSSETHPNVPCVLHGELERHKKYVNSCNLQPMDDQDTLRSCHFAFESQTFDILDELPIHVKCGNYILGSVSFDPSQWIKMQPPALPLIAKSNVSWSLSSPHASVDYYFQLQFKQSEQPWQNAMLRNITAKQMSVDLPEDMLEMGRSYEARLRVKPSEATPFKGVWSSWSPIASWTSEVGRPPDREKPRSGPELQLSLGLVAAVLAFLVLFSWKYNRAGWVYRLKLPHVPNPSTYFHVLNSDHGGNFQKWLSPMFAPESFEVPQSFEDISTVQVTKAKDVTVLHEIDPAEWPYSGSKPVSSKNLDACPVYVSYKSGVVHSREEGIGQGVELEAAPLQISCSYEQLGGESRQPDPGCREQNEVEVEVEGEGEREQEGERGEEGEVEGESRQLDPGCREQNEVEVEVEGEGEVEGESRQPDLCCREQNKGEGEGEGTEDGPKEMDTFPPLTILPSSLPGHVTPSPIPLPPHLPSILLLPLTFHDFDSVTAPDSSNTSRPFEEALGRSPFAEIQPSSDGYLSVQSARLNNSL